MKSLRFIGGIHAALALLVLATASPLLEAAAKNRTRNGSSGTTNTAPLISGTAPTTVTVGAAYRFTPTASDAESRVLRFFISNKPAWASFSSSSGTLSGTPSATRTGVYRNIVIGVTDGTFRTSLPAFSITVAAATASTNRAPAISGSPSLTAKALEAYAFTPVATDPDGDLLGFSIANKPAWATFSTATGSLTGTPGAAHVGVHPGIQISVSDGKVSRTLPGFSITVAAAESPPISGTPTGSALLSWSAPARNTDGSSLTDLAGYRIYHGSSPGTLVQIAQLSGAGITSHTVGQLARGTHYFAVSAYTTTGAESALSAIGSKVVP